MYNIDLVYLWVDDNDQNWIAEKNKWQHRIKNLPPNSTGKERWCNNDELRYSLRSAEQFAPWIHHIYIVTGFGQIPEWLNLNNPNITIISHEQIMPESALPTFNSNAIEMCLANIPELSEHFLLANDDAFFGKSISPNYFYDKHDRAIFWYNKMRGIHKNPGLLIEELTSYNQMLFLTGRLFNNIFSVNYNKYLCQAHNITPYFKSSIIAASNHPLVQHAIDATIHNKFRTSQDLQRIFFNLYDHIHKRSVFRRVHKLHSKKHFIHNFFYHKKIINSPAYTYDVINSRVMQYDHPLFCINDTEFTTDIIRNNNKQFLQNKFPNKSRFEK